MLKSLCRQFQKTEMGFPDRVRVSQGSAVVLGILDSRIEVAPLTAYLLTYSEERCSANCGFCSQARTSFGRSDLLSRVVWPIFPLSKVASGIMNAYRVGVIKRVCIQAMKYANVTQDLLGIISRIRASCDIPLSVSIQPISPIELQMLIDAGVERIAIPLDAATSEIFEKVKGRSVGSPFQWDVHVRMLQKAVEVFGRERVTSHLIVGLGETDREIVKTMQDLTDIGIRVGLFAFTPVPGTALEDCSQPSTKRYRVIQLAYYLLSTGRLRHSDVEFDDAGKLLHLGTRQNTLREIVGRGDAFMTTGCPNCNRPFYNERPSGPIYNYAKQPTRDEISLIERDLNEALR